MVFVLEKLIEIVLEKLVDEGIKKIASILKVESDMEDLQRNMMNISYVLVDAESKKIESKSIALWLAELREVMYDAEDLLNDFAAARDRGSKSAEGIGRYIPGLAKLKEVSVKSATSTIIQGINTNLRRITSETSALQLLTSQPNADQKQVCRYNSFRITDTCSIQLDSDVVGIDDDATDLVDRITGDGDRAHSLFAITGMGGIGKTTLARKVFNHYLIKNHFDKTIWVCVSSNCSGEYLLKEIVRSIEKDYGESCVSHDELSSKVIEVVEGRRLFIILDDIWNANVWEKFLREPLLARTKYSRILITTRNGKVAKEMMSDHTHPMKEMDPSDGWPVLCKTVFEEKDNIGDMNELADVGKKIVHKCKGLPLAIKVVGGVLRTTDRTVAAWTRVLSSRIWSIRGLPEDVLPSLLLSYEDLPSHLKQCFVYCSLFPEDFKFSRVKLVYMWIAEGFIKKERGMKMEESAEEYYNELVMRNLLQVMPPLDECKMHDLLRSLALFVSQKQYIYVDPENFHSSGLIKHRHLWFSLDNTNEVPKEIIGQDYVRTLMLSGNSRIENFPPQLLSGLTRIRVLDLGNIEITTLPDSIGELIQLRFINISSAKLYELPESIKHLKNLETLIVSILRLRVLPYGIVKLYNLKHLLVCDILRRMPNGLDNLKNLRVLSCFVVNHGARSRQCTPNMKELKDLSELTDLSIYHLERVSNKKEAEEAAMKDKTSLKRLKLHCIPVAEEAAMEKKTSLKSPKSHCKTPDQTPRTSAIKKIEEVFAGIQIPQNLTELSIDGFFGKQFPAHMIGSDLPQVKSLKLERCESLEKVPSLGDMPKLETLHITNLSSVADFGSEFYGELKFPKLKYLHLVEMEKLERIFEVKQGAYFPCLIELSILYCPRLKSLGEGLQHATCLKTLVVHDVSKLESIENLSSISELKIYRNSRLMSVKNLPSLKKMKIRESCALKVVQNVGELSSLSVSGEKMETLPVWLTSTTVAPKKLKVRGSATLVLTTFQSAEDWKFLKKCLYVEVKTSDKSKWMSYRKDLDRCDSNLPGSSGASSSSVTITEILTALWRKNIRYRLPCLYDPEVLLFPNCSCFCLRN